MFPFVVVMMKNDSFWKKTWYIFNSVQGQLPRLRYDSQKFLNDPKYAYSQSYRIDAMQALQNAKKGYN